MATEILRATLQDALVNANDSRLACYENVSDYNNRIVQVRTNLQRAETEKAKADFANKQALEKYQALLNHSESLTDSSTQNALRVEVSNLAAAQYETHRKVQI